VLQGTLSIIFSFYDLVTCDAPTNNIPNSGSSFFSKRAQIQEKVP